MTLETGSSNVMVQVEPWKLGPTIHKYLFDVRSDSDDDAPEMVVFFATEPKMQEYLAKLRAKGLIVAMWNISAIENNPFVTIEDLLND